MTQMTNMTHKLSSVTQLSQKDKYLPKPQQSLLLYYFRLLSVATLHLKHTNENSKKNEFGESTSTF